MAESKEGARLSSALVKKLTGGDLIVARHLHKDPIQFLPRFKPVLCTNHRPVFPGDDEALWIGCASSRSIAAGVVLGAITPRDFRLAKRA